MRDPGLEPLPVLDGLGHLLGCGLVTVATHAHTKQRLALVLP